MKLCECGCGKAAPIAKKTCSRDGYRKGDPIRFIHGHQNRGKNNGQWTGGEYTKNSRLRIKRKDGRTKNGYIFNYRIIVEEVLGRPLSPKTVIHHHNGLVTDDRNSNLVVCEDRGYHSLIHKRQRAFEATGNPHALKCIICKGWGTDLLNYKTAGSYHRDCINVYNRKRKNEALNVF